MANEISTTKSVFILAAVAGCFVILWPKLFQPMLQSTLTPKHPTELSGCCDVMSDMDVNAIKVLTEMCGRIITKHDELDPKFLLDFQQGKLNKEIVSTCKKEVYNTCGVDITTFLAEQVGLGQTYKQILDNIRSFNNSVCLKQNFGIERGLLGAERLWAHTPLKTLRQERPPHMRPDIISAALKERGRAIPQSHNSPRFMEGRPGPIPGMRPPMGAGHALPTPKPGGILSVLMPLYTVGVIVIFVYTMFKLMMKRQNDAESASSYHTDPEFRRYVFNERHRSSEANGSRLHRYEESTRLGELEIEALRRRLQETEAAMEKIVAKIGKVSHAPETKGRDGGWVVQGENGIQAQPKREFTDNHQGCREAESEPASVKVVNMETTASCEGAKPMSRPSTPTRTPSRTPSRPATPLCGDRETVVLPEDAQAIYLEGSLPSQAQLLVADSETEAHKAEPGEVDMDNVENSNDPPVILSGRMTLSLIPDPLAIGVAHGEQAYSHSDTDSDHEHQHALLDAGGDDKEYYEDSDQFMDPMDDDEISAKREHDLGDSELEPQGQQREREQTLGLRARPLGIRSGGS